MKAGRDLDALVAEKVMDLTVYRDAGELWDGPHTALRAQPILRYSTSISAAWRVVEELQRRRHYVTIYAGPSSAMGTRCVVEAFEPAPHTVAAWQSAGDTAPHAICLAALRAVGVNVEDDDAARPARA